MQDPMSGQVTKLSLNAMAKILRLLAHSIEREDNIAHMSWLTRRGDESRMLDLGKREDIGRSIDPTMLRVYTVDLRIVYKMH
jgi:hypothetical protein